MQDCKLGVHYRYIGLKLIDIFIAAQKGFSPSSTERKKGRGGSFSGIGGGKEAGGAGRKSFVGGGKAIGQGIGFAGGQGKGLAGGAGKGFSGGHEKGFAGGHGKKGFASGKKGMMKESGGFGGAGKARPPPKWAPVHDPMAGGLATVTDGSHFAAGTTLPTVGAGGGSMMNNLMAMNVMGGGGQGDMFSEMMEMQRRLMRNNPQ